jgi:hypothetical protein
MDVGLRQSGLMHQHTILLGGRRFPIYQSALLSAVCRSSRRLLVSVMSMGTIPHSGSFTAANNPLRVRTQFPLRATEPERSAALSVVDHGDGAFEFRLE